MITLSHSPTLFQCGFVVRNIEVMKPWRFSSGWSSSPIISELPLQSPHLSVSFSSIPPPREREKESEREKQRETGRLDRNQLVSLSLCNGRLNENSTLISQPFHYVWHLHLCPIDLFRLLIGITLWMTSSGSGWRLLDFSCFAEEKHNDSLQSHDENIRLRESSNKCHGLRQTGRQARRQRERDIAACCGCTQITQPPTHSLASPTQKHKHTHTRRLPPPSPHSISHTHAHRHGPVHANTHTHTADWKSWFIGCKMLI